MYFFSPSYLLLLALTPLFLSQRPQLLPVTLLHRATPSRSTNCLAPFPFRLLGGSGFQLLPFIPSIYCYIRNCDKFHGLKQHTFIISKFLWVKNQGWLNWILGFSVSQESAIKVLIRVGAHLKDHLHRCWLYLIPFGLLI